MRRSLFSSLIKLFGSPTSPFKVVFNEKVFLFFIFISSSLLLLGASLDPFLVCVNKKKENKKQKKGVIKFFSSFDGSGEEA